MNCVKCNTELEILKIKSANIPYCKSCKGMWIKFPYLQKIAEQIELKTDIVNPVDMEPIKHKEPPKTCPQCGQAMDKIYFNGTVVDVCKTCNGIWFDNGELSKYFSLFMKQYPQITDNITFLDKYCDPDLKEKQAIINQEIEIQSKERERRVISFNGFVVLFLLLFFGLIGFVASVAFSPILVILIPIFILSLMGFKVIKPQEAMVLTVFGKYIGTLRGAGFHWVNPFAQSVTPFIPISLKAMTLDTGKQKINDELGNPIEVGIIVIWEVQDTAKAIFNVENYKTFIAAQSDSALRNIVRMYPYDAPEDSGVQSLRGDSAEISHKLKTEIQRNVRVAGINVVDAKITHLAYAPEIAVAMLQRQQAAAVIDAKKAIVDGAVGMVEMALNRLNENNVVKLDEVEKAKMVNNLLVTLCSNKEAQPVLKNNLN
ncbi:zf-TFIIB domain-containing protein [bacterium]|nr:zf-TFIIB domain-containing protein [bacterium]